MEGVERIDVAIRFLDVDEIIKNHVLYLGVDDFEDLLQFGERQAIEELVERVQVDADLVCLGVEGDLGFNQRLHIRQKQLLIALYHLILFQFADCLV